MSSVVGMTTVVIGGNVVVGDVAVVAGDVFGTGHDTATIINSLFNNSLITYKDKSNYKQYVGKCEKRTWFGSVSVSIGVYFIIIFPGCGISMAFRL